VPYGVYDVTANAGWVNVGITGDTAEFAVQSIPFYSPPTRGTETTW
jgi:Rhodopirellula transposase DDE domain